MAKYVGLPHFTNIDALKMDWDNPKSITERYKDKGDDLYWMDRDRSGMIIKDMTDDYIKDVVNRLRKYDIFIIREFHEHWLIVFNDVIMKRRRLKLNEILKNIDVPRGTNENEN